MNQAAKKFEKEGYLVTVVGKNVDVTNTIREYVEEKVTKIERLTNNILEVRVTLDLQKLRHLVDVILDFSHFKIKVHAVTDNLYSAIDKAFDKLLAKLRKWKERIQDHHAKGVATTEIEVSVLEKADLDLEKINKEIEKANKKALEKEYALPRVVKTKKRPLKMLTLDEAEMKMELSGDNFLVYKSEEEQKLKVIYRRRDGTYGVMAIE